jgi:Cu-Zn family superoxide dismutase
MLKRINPVAGARLRRMQQALFARQRRHVAGSNSASRRRARSAWAVPLALIAAVAAGCAAHPSIPEAVANLRPSSSSTVSGTVHFRQVSANDVRISGTVRGLQPNSEHGFHIHEKGDCSAKDASSAGEHFNPHDGHHGRPDDAASHAGDLPSLHADSTGTATFSIDTHQIKIGKGAGDIIGRSLVVDRDADDHLSQPAGDSGPRFACAVIREN